MAPRRSKIEHYDSRSTGVAWTDLKGLVRFLTMVILAMADYETRMSALWVRRDESKAKRSVWYTRSGRSQSIANDKVFGANLAAFDSQRHDLYNGGVNGTVLTILRASAATASSLRAS